MTIAKGAAIGGGLLLAMAVSVWTGQRIAGSRHHPVEGAPKATAPGSDALATVEEPPANDDGVRAVLTTRPLAPVNAGVLVSTPALDDRLRPLLDVGTDLDQAADGFGDAEQFAAVVHAARNTDVPFVVLKHRVLDAGRSLADAIGELNPGVDASIEAERAKTEAKSDLASLAF